MKQVVIVFLGVAFGLFLFGVLIPQWREKREEAELTRQIEKLSEAQNARLENARRRGERVAIPTPNECVAIPNCSEARAEERADKLVDDFFQALRDDRGRVVLTKFDELAPDDEFAKILRDEIAGFDSDSDGALYECEARAAQERITNAFLVVANRAREQRICAANLCEQNARRATCDAASCVAPTYEEEAARKALEFRGFVPSRVGTLQ